MCWYHYYICQIPISSRVAEFFSSSKRGMYTACTHLVKHAPQQALPPPPGTGRNKVKPKFLCKTSLWLKFSQIRRRALAWQVFVWLVENISVQLKSSGCSSCVFHRRCIQIAEMSPSQTAVGAGCWEALLVSRYCTTLQNCCTYLAFLLLIRPSIWRFLYHG